MPPHRRATRPASDLVQAQVSRALDDADGLVRVLRDTADRTNHDHVAYYRLMIASAKMLADLAVTLTQRLALNSVIEGATSRRLAADMVGVHKATIARWLQDLDNPSEPQPLYNPDETPENTRKKRQSELDTLLIRLDHGDDIADE